jgi:hypothetical protein
MAKVKEFKVVSQAQEQQEVQEVKAPKISMSFDAWWLLAQNMHGLKPMLKDAVKKHMEAKGFLANEEYAKGLKDFGINT